MNYDPLSDRKKNLALHTAMKSARATHDGMWRDCADYILPRASQFTLSDANKGGNKNQKILDGTATKCAETLSAGLMSGMTNPATKWLMLTPPDEDLKEYQPVKIWIDYAEQLILKTFLKSNLYSVLPGLYEDTGVFETGAMCLLEDDKSIIRLHEYPIGSFCLNHNAQCEVDQFAYEFVITVRQAVERYGEENCSRQVREAYRRGDTEQTVQCVHVIKPNPNWDESRMESKHKRFQSCVYELGTSDETVLSEKGHDEFPILAPRWKIKGQQVYGSDGPGYVALPDVKELQRMQLRYSIASEKLHNPPMKGPATMVGQRASTAAGDMTYVPVGQGQEGFVPTYQVNPNLSALEFSINDRRSRIDQAFFKDVFLMFSNSDRREMTAEEVVKRHEEKIMMLGPVLGRMDQDVLKPLVDRTFAILWRAGKLHEPPPELRGMELEVEFISVLHQAQKLVGLGPIERVLGQVERIAQFYPDILDKVDLDQTIDESADILGAPPKMIRPDDQVAQIRAARAKQQQAMQQAQIIEQASKAAKNLGTTPLEGDTALSRLAAAQQTQAAGPA